MKKLLASVALIGALGLGGCATTGGGAQPIIADITAFEQSVQQVAVAACSFLPTTATVAGILSSLFPGVSTTEQLAATIAGQICNAVVPVASSVSARKRLGATVYYPGTTIPIHGTFVGKTGVRSTK